MGTITLRAEIHLLRMTHNWGCEFNIMVNALITQEWLTDGPFYIQVINFTLGSHETNLNYNEIFIDIPIITLHILLERPLVKHKTTDLVAKFFFIIKVLL